MDPSKSNKDFDVLEIQGLQVSSKNDLYIMVFADGHGYDVEQWSKLEEDHEEYELIIDKVHEKVMSIYKGTEAVK